jgi:hypothetical protein
MSQAYASLDVRAGWPLRAVQAWDRFWFSPGDPTVLGLMRICCGLMLLWIYGAYSWDLQTFFGVNGWLDLKAINEFRQDSPVLAPPTGWEETRIRGLPEDPKKREEYERYVVRWGVDPDSTVARGRSVWSIWLHVTDPRWMYAVHGLILTVMFLFTIGLCTRVMAVLTWVGMLCYVQRSPVSLFGMDTIINVVVLYLMIGPSGAALSVDRLIARYLATRRALRQHLPAPQFGRPEPRISANLALRLMQVHVCIIYAASGLSKLQGDLWWNGTAVWATMANYEFSPVRYALYSRFLYFLVQHRWLWEVFVTGATAATLVFELTFACLVWIRQLRWTMLISAVLLHLGIAFFMGLVTFSTMMLILVMAFVPVEAVYRGLWWLGRGSAGLQFAPAGG